MVELAGGAGPVAKRARAKFDEGDPIAAIELAEAALGADPSHEPALRTMLEAHVALERASENFWLTSWLRERIREIREKLESE